MVRKHAKKLLEQALMTLLEESSLDKVDVRELAKQAGLSRQTFYYNFKNKQDMIDWIFKKNNEKAKQSFQETYSLHDYILTTLNTIAQNRQFYANVLLGDYQKDVSPGPFEQGIISSIQEIELHSNLGRMSTEQWDSLIFFAFGAKGMVMHWLTDNMRVNAEAMTGIILANIPTTLKDYIDNSRK